jgi:hypothetical protein
MIYFLKFLFICAFSDKVYSSYKHNNQKIVQFDKHKVNSLGDLRYDIHLKVIDDELWVY